MKKLIALTLAMLMLVTLVACAKPAEPAAPADPADPETPAELVIGVMEDITGATGQQGTGAQAGIEMLAEDINAAGGINGTKIRLVSYDIKGDVTESINAYKRLCEEDKVHAVIGPHISNIGIALAPLSETYKVPIVGAYIDDKCAATEPGNPYRYMFIAQPSASQQAAVIADYTLNTLGAKNIAVLYNSSNSYCTSLADPFMKLVEAAGAKIVCAETFTDSDTDYRTQLSKIKTTNPDAIYFPNYPAQVPLCVNQSRELGITCDLVGSNSFIPNIYLCEANGENNTYFPYNIDYANDKIATFNKEFADVQGFDTNAQTYVAMDALSSIVAAYEKCGSTDSEALTDAMTQITVAGWMGDFTYSADTHLPVGLPYCVLNVVDGAPNTVATLKTK